MSRRHLEEIPLPAAHANGATDEVRADCPCPKRGCDLHGQCAECRQKHGRKGQLPRCER